MPLRFSINNETSFKLRRQIDAYRGLGIALPDNVVELRTLAHRLAQLDFTPSSDFLNITSDTDFDALPQQALTYLMFAEADNNKAARLFEKSHRQLVKRASDALAADAPTHIEAVRARFDNFAEVINEAHASGATIYDAPRDTVERIAAAVEDDLRPVQFYVGEFFKSLRHYPVLRYLKSVSGPELWGAYGHRDSAQDCIRRPYRHDYAVVTDEHKIMSELIPGAGWLALVRDGYELYLNSDEEVDSL